MTELSDNGTQRTRRAGGSGPAHAEGPLRVAPPPPPPPPPARGADLLSSAGAADELLLDRAEFETAAELGLIASHPGYAGTARRVPLAEVERLRAAAGFPGDLRERVRTVGTAEGAALLGIAPTRFTRLARLGLLAPVRFYLNRYRAVVWLYLAEELREFAAARPELLDGPLPGTSKASAGPGHDLRAATWRRRRRDCLHRLTSDPWERAAAVAAQLGPGTLRELVPDPAERDYLHRLRPAPQLHATPGGPAAAIAERIMVVDTPEERATARVRFARELTAARVHRSAPGSSAPARRLPQQQTWPAGPQARPSPAPSQSTPPQSTPTLPAPLLPAPSLAASPPAAAPPLGAAPPLAAAPFLGAPCQPTLAPPPVTGAVAVRCCRSPLPAGTAAPPCCVLRAGPADGGVPRDAKSAPGALAKGGGRLRTWLRPDRAKR